MILATQQRESRSQRFEKALCSLTLFVGARGDEVRAMSERCQSDFRAMSEQCQSDVRAMSERCQSDFRAMSEQCQSDVRAMSLAL